MSKFTLVINEIGNDNKPTGKQLIKESDNPDEINEFWMKTRGIRKKKKKEIVVNKINEITKKVEEHDGN